MNKFIFVLFLLIFITENLIAEQKGFAPKTNPFQLSWALDGALLGGGVAAFATSAFLSQWANKVLPDWDNRSLDAGEIWSFDKWAVRSYSEKINVVGDVTQILSMAVPLVFFAFPQSHWSTLIVMYAEALAWNWALKEGIKTGFERYRPYMYADDIPDDKLFSGDYRRSFPSGHTALAFNGAAFTSYVFAKYFPHHPATYVIIPTSCVLATACGALRIAAGAHFLSDVLVGATIGVVTGVLIPFLHTLPVKKSPVMPAISPAGVSIRAKF